MADTNNGALTDQEKGKIKSMCPVASRYGLDKRIASVIDTGNGEEQALALRQADGTVMWLRFVDGEPDFGPAQ